MPEPVANPADIAIEARSLGIRYRRYTRRVATLKQAVVNLFRGNQFESFWALRQIDLVVRSGESVGVLGPNGSGKSTLMKAIAGVLPPAEGSIRTQGLIAPLIELGGGFNPELTGRENVFLNGAIMGRSRRETERKMPGIIEFADLGDFIDAPLSTYSSGMRARLGFAAATDIDPDILLLDEILSVGDAAFSAKATERMERFFREGKTVVTVSHNLQTIRRLCNRAVYLRGGRVIFDGPAEEAVTRYQEDVARRKEKVGARAASVRSSAAG